MTLLAEHLQARRDRGRKLLVPYVVGGIPDAAGFGGALQEVSADADAVEVGLPYSDPLMDGPTIAAAAARALHNGIGPHDVLDLVARATISVPLIAMTYFNPIHVLGEREFCRRAGASGVAGLIVPDLPLEESAPLRREAARHDLAWIPLVAPTSPPGRVAALAATATGFVYAVSRLGVTGVRTDLAASAAEVAGRCRDVTDLPVLIGIGISTPDQAIAAAAAADGVVVGSAVVTRIVEQSPGAAADFLRAVRDGLDGMNPRNPGNV